MTDRLAGKTAFITAAGQGIGRATAEAFVREGARVVATDINEELLADLARTLRCETRRLDVTDASAVLAASIEAQAKASGQTLAQVEAAFVARQPMGRLGTTAEIAALAVYLASDESAFTTGTIQVIDGGWSN